MVTKEPTTEAEFVAANDTQTMRTCGTCGRLLPVEAFYKDGKDNNGNIRYRRDCKECYKCTRITSKRMKGRKHHDK